MPLPSPVFPGALATVSDLLLQKNFLSTETVPTLASAVGALDGSFDVVAGTGTNLPTDNFTVTIDDEIIFVTSRTVDTCTVGTRGYEGTTGAAHSAGAQVNAFITAKSHNQLAAEIVSIETQLGIGLANVDPAGAAATAQSNAEAFAADADNISSGTVGASFLPAPGGDIGGTYAATVVEELQGIPLLYAPAPASGQVLQFDGVNWTPTNPSSAAGQILYLNKTADALGGLYKVWGITPDTSAETTVSWTGISGDGTVEFADFITPSGYPDITLLPAGDWQYDIYAQVSSSAGTTNLILGWYKRTAGGVETLLFSQTINLSLLNTAVQLYSTAVVEASQSLAATDRLVLKLSANTTRGTSTTVTVYTDGTTHYSHVHSTLGTGVNAPVQSVFGRTGAVVAASNDYGFSQLSGGIAVAQMNSGTNASLLTFWRGDGTWAFPNAGVNSVPGSYSIQAGDNTKLISLSGGLVVNLPSPTSNVGMVLKSVSYNAGTSHNSTAAKTTTGNLMLIIGWMQAITGTMTIGTDTAGNTYTTLAGPTVQSNGNSGQGTMQAWYCANATGNAANVIPVATSGSVNLEIYVIEIQGLATASPLDIASAINVQSSGVPTASAITTTNANDFILSFHYWAGGNTTGMPGVAGSGYTTDFYGNDANSSLTNASRFLQSQAVSSTGTYTAALTSIGDGNTGSASFSAAFKIANAAANTFTNGFTTTLENVSATPIWVNGDGCTVDGVRTGFVLQPTGAVQVWTDGTNWFTDRQANSLTQYEPFTPVLTITDIKGSNTIAFAAQSTVVIAGTYATLSMTGSSPSLGVGSANGGNISCGNYSNARNAGALNINSGVLNGAADAVIITTPQDTMGSGNLLNIKNHGTSELAVNFAGKIATYGSIATVANGVPSELAKVDLTAQTADKGVTTLYAVPATGAGIYRVSGYIAVTTVDAASSTLPSIVIAWTDADNSTAQSFTLTPTNAGNVLTTLQQGLMVVNAKASTNIQYSTSGYASGATPMAFALHLKLEAL